MATIINRKQVTIRRANSASASSAYGPEVDGPRWELTEEIASGIDAGREAGTAEVGGQWYAWSADRDAIVGTTRRDVERGIADRVGSECRDGMAARMYDALGGQYEAEARGCVVRYSDEEWTAAMVEAAEACEAANEQAATDAAEAHLTGIGWHPGDGLSDADLGLGTEAWGGCPDGVAQRYWNAACEAAVRRLARERTDA